jgi:hypothetical protein
MLGPGLYQGYPGGLYPGGANQRPAAHDAAGVAIAQALVPLDTLGLPDPVGGRVVVISIGMSNCTQEFSAFVPKATNDPAKKPQVLVIDCAKGGQTAQAIRSPSAAYWDTVVTRLRGRGSSPAQVQVCWIKEANAQPSAGFPAAMLDLQDDLAAVVRVAKAKLANLKLAYLTSRIYAGYADTPLNPEPYAYESGFAVKGLIETQIAGVDSLNYDSDQGPVEAPWLAWGPYLWADGTNPRDDGLWWPCSYFANDGTHPGPLARQLVSDSLLAFFRADDTTAPWYLAQPLGAPAGVSTPGPALALAPNPARGAVEIRFAAARGESWRLEVLDLAGRRVREVGRGVGTGSGERREWDGRDEAGAPARTGVYWVRFIGSGAQVARRLAWMGGG